ncbi:hypothetical protein B0T24DRAFT_669811 [Lasiosphaeria ovina]|uniref:Uncharacterized protein n=1 Tax=Lasiosphaeria ovina TaxID=92902 RepID=A0AAE0JW85_9PEZI|nr:hypothetical protein B0T24DRAFT_669811 [Lasiosphaeria ovina]
MATTLPTSDAIKAAARQPLERAFDGNGCLYAGAIEHRWAFFDPGSRISSPTPWHKHFDAVLDCASHLSGPSAQNLYGTLNQWQEIWDQAKTLYHAAAPPDLYKSAAAGDTVPLQNSLLALYADGLKLATAARKHSQEMEASWNLLQEGANALKTATEPIKGSSWVDFAREVCKEQGSALERSVDWFPHLNRWAEFGDWSDNSAALCQMALDRLAALRTHLDQLPALLDPLPVLCFDVYGKLLSGATVGTADMAGFAAAVHGWLQGSPSWQLADLSPRKKVHCGEVWYYGQVMGDDPDAVVVERDEDVLCGLTCFHFGKEATNKDWGPIATQLRVVNPGRARRVWEQGRHEADFHGTRLSWLEVPVPLRQQRGGVRFSTTRIDVDGSDFRISNPGFPESRGKIIHPNHGARRARWTVKFPGGPFPSDNVTVRPWLMDVATWSRMDVNWVDLGVEAVTRDGFDLVACMPAQGNMHYLRAGYAAYDASSPIEGFAEASHHLRPRGRETEPQNHNFQPAFVPFPPGKRYGFIWKFSFRADMRPAVGRDGVVIQGASWGDAFVTDLEWQVLAFANE